MAFSKAKILRFNDVKSCAPPPGAYTPKFDDIKYIKEKHIEPSSPASTCSDLKSTKSCASVPNFRTPTIPRLKKFVSSSSTEKAKSRLKLFNSQTAEELREKTVECQNKDETIKDLENQIDEIKLTITQLELEKQTILLEKNHLETTLKEEKEKLLTLTESRDNIEKQLVECKYNNEQLKQELKQVELELNTKKQIEIRQLQDNLDLVEKSLKKELSETEQLLQDTQLRLTNNETSCCNLQKDLLKKCEEIRELDQQYDQSMADQARLQKTHATELDALKQQHQTEIEDFEYELLKVLTENEKKITQLVQETKQKLSDFELEKAEIKRDYEKRMKAIQDLTEAQIRQCEENSSEKIKLAEIQMEEKCKELEHSWAMRLQEQKQESEEILKECQSIGEYTIIQTEIEKNQIKQNLQDTQNILDSLQAENRRTTQEKQELQKSVMHLQTEMSNLIIELNSVREKLGTEILNRELDLEMALTQKHSYEITLNKTHETVYALKNRLLNSDRDVEQLKLELDQLERTKLEEFTDMKEQLQQILVANGELIAENLSIQSLKDEVLYFEQTLLNQVDDLKLVAKSEKEALEQVIEEYKAKENDLQFYMNSQQKIISEAQIVVNDAKNENERLELENVDLKFKISRLESSIQHNNNQAVVENRNDNEENIYKKYINQSGKYDELQQRNIELNEIQKQQSRQIEKLTRELCQANKLNKKLRSIAPVDKENTCSPTKTAIATQRIDSPTIGKSPLKERN